MKASWFMRQPFIISGYMVTEENIEGVARWCGGHVIQPTREDQTPFIRVPVTRYVNVKQTEGHIGMWITMSMQRGEESFKVYTNESLMKHFIPLPREMDDENEVFGTEFAPRGVDNDPGEKTVDLSRYTAPRPREEKNDESGQAEVALEPERVEADHDNVRHLPIQKVTANPLHPFQAIP